MYKLPACHLSFRGITPAKLADDVILNFLFFSLRVIQRGQISSFIHLQQFSGHTIKREPALFFFLPFFSLQKKNKMPVNAFTLSRKYPQLQVNDINNLIDQFK